MPASFGSSGGMPSSPGHFLFLSVCAASCTSAAVMEQVSTSNYSETIVWEIKRSVAPATVSSSWKWPVLHWLILIAEYHQSLYLYLHLIVIFTC